MPPFSSGKMWFSKIFARNNNLFATINFSDTAFTNSIGNSFFDLIFIASQKPLAVHSTFFTCILAPVYELTHILT
jgi:hypothetical protein